MLAAVSGSQGAGKSTIIQQLMDLGYPVIQRKTSRSILSDWDVTLNQINEDPELTMKFQDEILKRKFMDEKDAINSAGIIFTERTYADLFTYALVSLGKNNRFDDWLNEYYFKCMKFQQSYDMVFYLTAGHFTPVADGVRGANKHYSSMVDLTMREFTSQMTPGPRLNVISTPVLRERTTIIDVQARATLQRDHFALEMLGSL
jgi:hypothetical protein